MKHLIANLLFSIRRAWARKSDRRLFVYLDGQSKRSIDPVQVTFALADHPTFRDDIHPKMVNDGDREAIEICAQAVCDVFSVLPYDPETECGLTVSERIALLGAFYDYCEWLKKNTEHFATSVPSMAPTSQQLNEPTPSDM